MARLSRITVILIRPGYSISFSTAVAISCEIRAARVVVDLARVDDHPDLAPGAHREHPLDALVAGGDLLEVAQPADVLLERLAAGPGPGARDGVGGLHDHRLDRPRLDLAVVGLDRVRDGLGLAVAAGDPARRRARAGPRPRG